MTDRSLPDTTDPAVEGYVLDDQIGFMLRKAYQRNSVIFAEMIPGKLTTTQFSVMFRLSHEGALSQNLLGRSVAMDGATTKGVVDRLIARGLLKTESDPTDGRRHLVSLTEEGRALIGPATEMARQVSAATLAPLRPAERRTLLRLLARIQ